MTTANLKQRVLLAGGWSMAGFGLSQVIRFGSNLLMTRLLVPEMFGVMAMVQVILYGLALFSDVGLRQNIVQSTRGNEPVYLNTAWVIQIMRGVLIWFLALILSLLALLANHIGFAPENSVFANPSLPYVIAVTSFSAVIAGFDSTKLFEAYRNLSFRHITQIELFSQVIGLACMLIWVAFDRSIWALVIGGIAAALTRTILSHTSLQGTANRLQWERAAFSEIIHFGKWIFASSILGFLARSGDRLLLGGMLSASGLGVYAIAFLIVTTVETVLSKIIGDVSYPALSEIIRERPADLKKNYYRFHSAIAAFAYFCTGVLMTSGQPLIALLYDPRYADAGWMLEILAVMLLTVPFRVAMQCFMAMGMPRLFSNIIAIQSLTIFIFIPIGFHYFGIPGAIWGITLSHFSSLPIIIFYKTRHGLFNAKKEFLLLPVVLAGIIAGKGLNLIIG